jgi:acyl-CoA synthetase (AMP-forming)/AMP-acid ligase II
MPNRPEYLAIWLGVTRVGGIVALINTDLSGEALAHCINAASPTHLIVDAELLEQVIRVRDDLATAPQLWIHGAAGPAGSLRIEDYLDAGAPPPDARVTIRDRALFIYTSGSTGLPKAALVSHGRLMQWTHWFAGLLDVTAADRMYDCLPMFHSVGGVVAPGATLVGGGSVVIGRRFSARRFWDDIVGWDCTMFQYIGEFCRYLLNSAPHPCERDHRLRLCCGNGLRGDVWEPFVNRFAIPRVLEFYASTEGNVSLANVEGMPGAIGRIPPFLAHRFPAALIRYDEHTEAPLRDGRGMCVPCGVNEPGEAIGRLDRDPANVGSWFEGYTDEGASRQRIVRDVFEPGDAWCRTGDLMRRDERGYVYFLDRLGDTFRWKGENVATSRSRQRHFTVSGHHGGRGLRRRRARRGRTGGHGGRHYQRAVRSRRLPPLSSSRRSRRTRARCSCAYAAASTRRRPSSMRLAVSCATGTTPPASPIGCTSTTSNVRATSSSIRVSTTASRAVTSREFIMAVTDKVKSRVLAVACATAFLNPVSHAAQSPGMTISPVNPTIVVGQTQPFTATGGVAPVKCRPAANTRASACRTAPSAAPGATNSASSATAPGRTRRPSSPRAESCRRRGPSPATSSGAPSCLTERRCAGALEKRDSAATARTRRSRSRPSRCRG